MKTLILLVPLTFISQLAWSAQWLCRSDAADANEIVAITNYESSDQQVKLFVPKGETAGRWYDANCWASSAKQGSYTCSVLTSSDTGYEIQITDEGHNTPAVTAQSWILAYRGLWLTLPCALDFVR